MGLRSSDDDGRDSPQETWNRMQEVKALREVVRQMMALLEHPRRSHCLNAALQALRKKPEVQRALNNVFEGIVK